VYVKIVASKRWDVFETQCSDTAVVRWLYNIEAVFGRPFVKRFTLCYRTIVCPVCLWLWCVVAKRLDGSRWTWHGSRPRSRSRCVRWGPSSPPQFSAHVRCGQTAGRIKMPLGTEVGLDPGDCVRWGPSSPLPEKRGHSSPNFLPMSIVAERSPISATAELLLCEWWRGRIMEVMSLWVL